jgi:signal transduction histidine kinase
LNIYTKKIRWKFFLLLLAIFIGAGSLYYTRILVDNLAEEERKRVEIWAKATALIGSTTSSCEGIDGFLLQIIENNTTIPVVVADSGNNIMHYRNIPKSVDLSDIHEAKKLIDKMKGQGNVIEINMSEFEKQFLFYDKSLLLNKLLYFPYIQLGVILLFIVMAYMAFNTARNAEQNQVWLGLSKETAHQLGTPTSSLMAWVELLKNRDIDDSAIKELDKDVQRLSKITERFSKIGSRPKLSNANLYQVLSNAVDYIKTRSSYMLQILIETHEKDITIPLNVELFEWVIENLCKNAIDAMEGTGSIHIKITDNTQVVYIDFTDTGKGVPKSKFKTIFKPGYTTKERGWGLGLSLSERIIEHYHNGKIFVHFSEIGKGTRFRIVLKKFF